MSDGKVVEQPQVEGIEEGATVSVVSRNEKKARKLLKGTGIKKVEGVSRVVLRRRNGSSFIISQPDVYRTPNGSYIVFGEAQVQQHDFAQQIANLAGQAGETGEADKSPSAIQSDLENAVNNLSVKEDAEEVGDADVDTTGLDEDKIAMIVEQANVSKSKAVKTLREHDGDLVNALMALTS